VLSASFIRPSTSFSISPPRSSEHPRGDRIRGGPALGPDGHGDVVLLDTGPFGECSGRGLGCGGGVGEEIVGRSWAAPTCTRTAGGYMKRGKVG